MSRLIIVANRLPFTIEKEAEEIKLRQSSGGLVSAIKSYFENKHQPDGITQKLWMGVADFPQEDWESIKNKHSNLDFEMLPIFPDKQIYNDHYLGFSNSVLWPLFHYFSSLAENQTSYYDAYVQV